MDEGVKGYSEQKVHREERVTGISIAQNFVEITHQFTPSLRTRATYLYSQPKTMDVNNWSEMKVLCTKHTQKQMSNVEAHLTACLSPACRQKGNCTIHFEILTCFETPRRYVSSTHGRTTIGW